jgi:hypothetical protein
LRNGPDIQIRAIFRSALHPAYQPSTANDVPFCDAAVIKVDRPFLFNEYVRRVNLPPHENDPKGITFNKVEILHQISVKLIVMSNSIFFTICFDHLTRFLK